MNSYQQQLLHILNIKNLNLNNEFQNFSVAAVQQQANASSNNTQQTAAETTELTLLASDIRLLLSQLTPELSWQIEPKASHCYCEANVLITPELSLLQQAPLKRQLWQLLDPRFNDV